MASERGRQPTPGDDLVLPFRTVKSDVIGRIIRLGEVVDCIRTTARAPLLLPGLPGAGDSRAASVARDCGAPPAGVDP